MVPVATLTVADDARAGHGRRQYSPAALRLLSRSGTGTDSTEPAAGGGGGAQSWSCNFSELSLSSQRRSLARCPNPSTV